MVADQESLMDRFSSKFASFFKAAAGLPVVAPYEPARDLFGPGEVDIGAINKPVRKILGAEMRYEYMGRNPEDGEKIYDPYLIVDYKDGERIDGKVFFGQQYDEVMEQYRNWCQEQGLEFVEPSREDYSSQQKEYKDYWQRQAQEKEEKEEEGQQQQVDRLTSIMEQGQTPPRSLI
jgi:hypothetical protein